MDVKAKFYGLDLVLGIIVVSLGLVLVHLGLMTLIICRSI